jgi:hypothetical protein
MRQIRFRLLVVAALLAGVALLSTAPARAQCFLYCWRVDATTSCCQFRNCEIVC